MTRPRLLDLFCGAGGCSVGYHRAGFDVVGVDLHPQPRYPYEFIQADALEVLTDSTGLHRDFDAIHASPPCQAYSDMSNCRPGLADEYPALIGTVRQMLEWTGLPYVMENVDGAPLAAADDLLGRYGVTLCGRMFGLELYRHRVFETSFPIVAPHHPRHEVPASKAGHWKPGTVMSVSGHVSPMRVARKAMGIDWMNRAELAESIPPAYTEFIGAQLLDQLEVGRAARAATRRRGATAMNVNASEMVGHVGSTGASTGPHLRFELQPNVSEMLNALTNLKSDLDMAITQRDGYRRRAENLQQGRTSIPDLHDVFDTDP